MRVHSIPPLTEKDIVRFWSKVERRGPSECWFWNAATSKNGYGVIRIADKLCYAHRVAYTIAHGEIPEGFTVDHVKERGCISRRCTNPDHLEPVTNEENVRRGSMLVETCRRGHPRTPENLYYCVVNKNGRPYLARYCKACQRERDQRKRDSAA